MADDDATPFPKALADFIIKEETRINELNVRMMGLERTKDAQQDVIIKGTAHFREVQEQRDRIMSENARLTAALNGRGDAGWGAEQWISVTEYRPAVPFLAYHPKWGIKMGFYDDGRVAGEWAGEEHATDWMPLPQPPLPSQGQDGEVKP